MDLDDYLNYEIMMGEDEEYVASEIEDEIGEDGIDYSGTGGSLYNSKTSSAGKKTYTTPKKPMAPAGRGTRNNSQNKEGMTPGCVVLCVAFIFYVFYIAIKLTS